MADVGKAMEQLLQCADESIELLSRDSATATGTSSVRAAWAFDESWKAVQKLWGRSQSRRSSAASNAERAACAKAWIAPYVDRKLFTRMEVLFISAKGQVAVATDASSPAASRRTPTLLAVYASMAAIALLDHACVAVSELRANGSSRSDKELTQIATLSMAQRGFMSAVADAARGWSAFASFQPSTARARQPGQDDATRLARHKGYVNTTAAALARYTSLMAQALVDMVRTGAHESSGSVPQVVSQLAESLEETQLLAAAASAVVGSSNPFANDALRPETANTICMDVGAAAVLTATAMFLLTLSRGKLSYCGGREGWRLAAALLRVMRHVAVQRLQVALLDQLAAHAGMGAELGPSERDGQVEGARHQGQAGEAPQVPGQQSAQGQRQQQQQAGPADAWTGSSGAWWYAREEAKRGQLMEVSGQGAEGLPRRHTAGWLEDYHCHIVFTTMWEWADADIELAEEAGVLARPPPLLAAQLAARTAEALCRLCRGEGLEGAYSPAPEWDFATAENLAIQLVPAAPEVAPLPVAASRACLPYWLEAAGWVAALMADATAASMGRLPATPRTGTSRSALSMSVFKEGSQASTLERILLRIGPLVNNKASGLGTLSASARADVRRRMFRCGLAASLDHTLRLLYSAEDSQQAGAADLAIQVSGAARLLIQFRMLPLLPPTEAPSGGMADSVRLSGASDCSSGCGSGGGGGGSGGGSSSDGSSSVGGSSSNGGSSSSAVAQGGEPADPLGLLFTLSKRAAMYTRALEALSAHGDAHAQGLAMQQVMSSAGDTLALLHVVVFGVQEDLRPIIGQARDAAAASMAGRGAANAACRAADGACVDEAHEALALAARAACNLAATLAWQVAAAAGEFTEPEAALYLYDTVGHAVRGLLACMEDWCSYPLALPTAQLLACQPHRLLAAACALAAALPTSADVNEPLRDAIGSLVSLMSVHETFNGRMRSWLAEFAAGGAASSDSTDDAEGDACAGCLAGPLQSLQRAAAGVGAPGASGSSSSAAGQAAAIAEVVANIQQFLHARGVDNRCWNAEALTPFGSSAAAQREGTTNGCGLPPLQHVSAPPGPLPPPLVPPPSRAGALPRLYVCGNPRCGNFGCEGEWALRLKQCGGCRAVRYCGADCQRAHWREGHRSECKAWAVPA